MAVDRLNRSVVGDGDMVGSNADHFAIFLMGFVNSLETATAPSLQKKPEIGKSGQTWRRDITKSPFLDIGENVVGGEEAKKKIRRIRRDKIGNHGDYRDKQVLVIGTDGREDHWRQMH